MAIPEAVQAALDLFHVPTRVRGMTAAPLPVGVDVVLAIASGDLAVLSGVATASGRSEETIREAAKFFIEQILLAPGADSYRILGATPSTEATELRRNMALLSKWLHPDAGMNVNRPAFTGRVNAAWDNLKTPERRAAYDVKRLMLQRSAKSKTKQRRAGPASTLGAGNYGGGKHGAENLSRRPPSRLRRALMTLLGRPAG